MNVLWERDEIIALRERAQALALEDDIAGTWRRAYQHLADALDYVDAMTARCEVRPGPSVCTSPSMHEPVHFDDAARYARRMYDESVEELRNIGKNAPLFPGDTISHATADECVRLGWAMRDGDGNFVLTVLGKAVLDGPTGGVS